MSDKEKFFEEKLKPCPWYGTDEYLEFITPRELGRDLQTDLVSVICNHIAGGCGTTNGFTTDSQSQAAQKWNNRRLYNE